MLAAGDVLDLIPLDTKFYIRQTAVETNGRLFGMDIELGPQTGGTPVHTHPSSREGFKVLQGQFDIFIDGEWKTLSVGESALVDEGVPHTFRNASDEISRVYMSVEPALNIEQYFDRLEKLVNSGVVESQQMNLKALIHLSMLMTSYPDEIHPVQPPYPIMRLLALIGRLLGYQV